MSRVLIVDDEPHVREVLRDFLTRVGDEVATAETGAAALEAVPTFQPDVILLDMVMPGMSGADVLDALRRAGLTVPVILISGQPITPPEGIDEKTGPLTGSHAPLDLRRRHGDRRIAYRIRGSDRRASPERAPLDPAPASSVRAQYHQSSTWGRCERESEALAVIRHLVV